MTEIEKFNRWVMAHYGSKHFASYEGLKAAWLARAALDVHICKQPEHEELEQFSRVNATENSNKNKIE